MTTLLFVHGTGVRQPSYDNRFDDVCAGLAAIRPTWRVARCYWGDEHGAKLNSNGASIPVASSRGLAVAEEDPERAAWWALERDPLFELRLITSDGVERALFESSSAQSATEQFTAAVADLPSKKLAVLLADAGLANVFADATATVLADEACQTALESGHRFDDLAAPIARAFIMQSLLEAATRFDHAPEIDGDTRDELVRATVDALDATGRGFGSGHAGQLVLNLAMRSGGSWYIDRKRATWSAGAAPMAGDVLAYLARGGRIKDFIADRIAEIEGPVVILAHSLGGIAALELLITRTLPQVQQLVTVGSQAPLLYELDALPTLPFGQPLPASVPAWTNIYDSRDLLAYCGDTVFPGRVADHPVDNRRPFPACHSAYFFRKNARFYRLLGEVLA